MSNYSSPNFLNWGYNGSPIPQFRRSKEEPRLQSTPPPPDSPTWFTSSPIYTTVKGEPGLHNSPVNLNIVRQEKLTPDKSSYPRDYTEEASRRCKRTSDILEIRDIKRERLSLDRSMYPIEESSIFLKPQKYNGYTMHRLQRPIIYQTRSKVELKKTRYNFLMKLLTQEDRRNINEIIVEMSQHFILPIESLFINGKHTMFTANDHPYQTVKYADGQMWSLFISIQGYKTHPINDSSLIWNLIECSK